MAYDVGSVFNTLDSLRKLASNFGRARKYQRIDLTDGLVHTLNVPQDCQYAWIRLQSSSVATNTPVAWYLNDNETPAVNSGMPLLGWEVFDLGDAENLINFKIIATGGTEYLHVQYFNIAY